MNKERLIIKNFGPIADVDIELRRFNFIIGNQATGKSTICKTLAIVRSIWTFLMPEDMVFREFEKYELSDYFGENSKIEYVCKDFSFTLNLSEKKGKRLIRQTQDKHLQEVQKRFNQPLLPSIEYDALVFETEKRGYQSKYIPAERILISLILSYSYNEIKFPHYIKVFWEEFLEATKVRQPVDYDCLKVTYLNEDGGHFITHKGITLPLSKSASGFKSTVPLLLVVDNDKNRVYTTLMYLIEEPEISLFPETQYNLVKHLVEKSNEKGFSLVVSTHSPYILSAVNNLIYAHTVGAKESKIIDEKYWIDPKDVTAIMLTADGKKEDLMDYELKQLKAEKIDEVSNKINDEYDQLSDLFWSKK